VSGAIDRAPAFSLTAEESDGSETMKLFGNPYSTNIPAES
jgi:hypothetical protein